MDLPLAPPDDFSSRFRSNFRMPLRIIGSGIKPRSMVMWHVVQQLHGFCLFAKCTNNGNAVAHNRPTEITMASIITSPSSTAPKVPALVYAPTPPTMQHRSQPENNFERNGSKAGSDVPKTSQRPPIRMGTGRTGEAAEVSPPIATTAMSPAMPMRVATSPRLTDAAGCIRSKDRQKEPRTVPPAGISLSRRVHNDEPIHVRRMPSFSTICFPAAKASCENPMDLSRKPASQYER